MAPPVSGPDSLARPDPVESEAGAAGKAAAGEAEAASSAGAAEAAEAPDSGASGEASVIKKPAPPVENYSISSAAEMEALYRRRVLSLAPDIARVFGEAGKGSASLEPFFKKAGLMGGSRLSDDFVRLLPLPGIFDLFVEFSRGELHNLTARRNFRFPLTSKNRLYLKNFFENNLQASITDGRFRRFAEKKADRDMIMNSILAYSKKSRLDNRQRFLFFEGVEIFGIERDSDGKRALQGNNLRLTSQDMRSFYVNDKRDVHIRRREQEASYDLIIKALESGAIEALGVNMTSNFLSFGVLKLASYIKEKGVDIHVLGYCNLTCSNYLLPAAGNVYIEQHGIVLYGGMAFSFMEETLREWLDGLVKEAKEKHQSDISQAGGVLHFFESWGWEVHALFVKHLEKAGKPDLLKKFQSSQEAIARNKETGWHGEEKETVDYSAFTPEELELISQYLFFQLWSFGVDERIVSRLSHDAEAERQFFESLLADAPDSKYSFLDFFQLNDRLTKYPQWISNRFHPLDRSFYRGVSEDEKFEFLIPDTQLLKDIGINIAGGENSAEKMPPGLDKSAYVELSGEDIENCRLFEREEIDAAELARCLSLSKQPSL